MVRPDGSGRGPASLRLRDLPGLGPASERMLAGAGVRTPEQLDEVGAVEAYRRVLDTGARPSRNLLWALEAALLDLDWRLLPAERREALLAALAGPVPAGEAPGQPPSPSS